MMTMMMNTATLLRTMKMKRKVMILTQMMMATLLRTMRMKTKVMILTRQWLRARPQQRRENTLQSPPARLQRRSWSV